MKKIQKFAKRFIDIVFRRLDAPRKNYENTMINNLDNLQRVLRKGDVILVEGNSEISRMIKLFTHSTWSHSALYVGDELVKNENVHSKPIKEQFGNDAHHMIVEAFTGSSVTAAPIRRHLKNIFYPILFVGASILNQNLIFEMPSSVVSQR